MDTHWQEQYDVRSYHVDFRGEAMLGAMCRFMQEAASEHAERLGVGFEALTGKGMAWILARQRIEIERMPEMGESVTARTWPSGKDRLFFYRDYALTAADRSPLLRATTAWFVIDIAKRERQPAEAFVERMFPMGDPQFKKRPARLRPEAGGQTAAVFPVRYGDLDVNGHVTNVRYLEWLVDSLPIAFHRAHRLRNLEVNFLAEALPGDEVRIENAPSNESVFAHAVWCGDRNVLLAKTSWDAPSK